MSFLFWLLTYLPIGFVIIFVEKKYKLRNKIQQKYPIIKEPRFSIIILIALIIITFLISFFVSNSLNLIKAQENMLLGFSSAIMIGLIIIIVPFKYKKDSIKDKETGIEKIDFCYYCGTELEDKTDTCPKCQKKI